MRVRLMVLLSWCPGLAAGLLAASAPATTLNYQSQTGTVSASGNTATLPSASQSFPVSGLQDVNLVASVANSDATSFYTSWRPANGVRAKTAAVRSA
jgi:hypothetical protein